MWKIKRGLVQDIIAASRNTYPDEFVALLGGNSTEKTADELVIVPSIFGSEHAIMRTDLLPNSNGIVGSVHSHPGYSNQPSDEDKHLFLREGVFHLIICEPFSVQSLAAYDAQGKKIKFEIVP